MPIHPLSACRPALPPPPEGRLSDAPLLYVIHRSSSSGGRGGANRAALGGLLRTLRQATGEIKAIFICDGLVSGERLETMATYGEAVPLHGVGEAETYRIALKIGLALPQESLVCILDEDIVLEEGEMERLFDMFALEPDTDYVVLGGIGARGGATPFAAPAARLRDDYMLHLLGSLGPRWLHGAVWGMLSRLRRIRNLTRLRSPEPCTGSFSHSLVQGWRRGALKAPTLGPQG